MPNAYQFRAKWENYKMATSDGRCRRPTSSNCLSPLIGRSPFPQNTVAAANLSGRERREVQNLFTGRTEEAAVEGRPRCVSVSRFFLAFFLEIAFFFSPILSLGLSLRNCILKKERRELYFQACPHDICCWSSRWHFSSVCGWSGPAAMALWCWWERASTSFWRTTSRRPERGGPSPRCACATRTRWTGTCA